MEAHPTRSFENFPSTKRVPEHRICESEKPLPQARASAKGELQ
jgi:hypothetical protein